MQLHSSLVPLAYGFSLVAGLGTYSLVSHMGANAPQALTIAQWVAGICNVVIGVPKNLFLGDFLSLLIARPLSLWGTVATLAMMHPA